MPFEQPHQRRQRNAQLATDGILSAAGAFSQKEAPFVFFGAGSELTRLDKREFTIALCIRLRTLPLSLSARARAVEMAATTAGRLTPWPKARRQRPAQLFYRWFGLCRAYAVPHHLKHVSLKVRAGKPSR